MSSDIPRELERSHAALGRRITDVQDFQLPRLEKLASGSLDRHAELCAELKADLEAISRSVENLAELGEEQVLEDDRLRALKLVLEMEVQVTELRVHYRRAALSSKAAVRANASRGRHELLGRAGSTSPVVPIVNDVEAMAQGSRGNESRREGGDNALQTKTNEVTDALRRTTALMQSELERSVLSVQILDESTQTVRATQTLYSRYESLLSTSSKLVKQLERADWYDRIIIVSALLFFLLVVGFIVKRRVLDKAVSGVGWWVGGSFKLVGMGVGKLVPGQRAKVEHAEVGRMQEEKGRPRLADVLEAAAPAVVDEVKPVVVKKVELIEVSLAEHEEVNPLVSVDEEVRAAAAATPLQRIEL